MLERQARFEPNVAREAEHAWTPLPRVVAQNNRLGRLGRLELDSAATTLPRAFLAHGTSVAPVVIFDGVFCSLHL
jgi:hypothetical protein